MKQAVCKHAKGGFIESKSDECVERWARPRIAGIGQT
jgi:hypothetical protein